MYHKILLAIDGSATSQAALAEAAKLAHAGAELHVINVTEYPVLILANPVTEHYDLSAMNKAVLEDSQTILRNAKQQLLDLGVKAETHQFNPAPDSELTIAEAILSYADACRADLIVLGTHGRQGIKRFFLGSVAEYVVRSAHIPVLLVRATPETATANTRRGEQFDDWPITPYTDR